MVRLFVYTNQDRKYIYMLYKRIDISVRGVSGMDKTRQRSNGAQMTTMITLNNICQFLWDCTKNNAQGCSLQLDQAPEVAWFSYVPIDGSGWKVPSNETYYAHAINNTGGVMVRFSPFYKGFFLGGGEGVLHSGLCLGTSVEIRSVPKA